MTSRERERLEDFIVGDTTLMKRSIFLLKSDITSILEEYSALRKAVLKWSEAREAYYMEINPSVKITGDFHNAETILFSMSFLIKGR